MPRPHPATAAAGCIRVGDLRAARWIWGMLPGWGVVPDHVARINAARLRSQGLFLGELRQMLRDLPQARHAHHARTPRSPCPHHAHTIAHTTTPRTHDAYTMPTLCTHHARTVRSFGHAVGCGYRAARVGNDANGSSCLSNGFRAHAPTVHAHSHAERYEHLRRGSEPTPRPTYPEM